MHNMDNGYSNYETKIGQRELGTLDQYAWKN